MAATIKLPPLLYSSRRAEAERGPCTSMVGKKLMGVELRPGDIIRPGLVQPRLSVWKPEDHKSPCLGEEDDMFCRSRILAPSHQPNQSGAACINQLNSKVDSGEHCDASARSSPTQEKLKVPSVKLPKTLRLFDLNMAPDSSKESTIFSPTNSTIDSVDSTAQCFVEDFPVMATSLSGHSMADADCLSFGSLPRKSFKDEGYMQGVPKLAVDLSPLQSFEPRRLKDIGSKQCRGNHVSIHQSKVKVPDMGFTGGGGPAHKKLKIFSEYAGSHSSTSITVSGTTDDDGDVSVGDVSKTSLPLPPDTKVHLEDDDDDDDEVSGAIRALLMLCNKGGRDPSSHEFRHRSVASLNENNPSVTKLDEEARRRCSVGSDLTPSDSISTRSVSSVLSRPSNKQRYRSMAELMAQTSISRRV